jgi:hypothetical protein
MVFAPWILEAAPDLETLYNLRLVNRAYYSAYQARPLSLIRRAMRRSCPAAWELREMCQPAAPYITSSKIPEQSVALVTPAIYMSGYTHEVYTVSRLIRMVLTFQEQEYLCAHTDALGNVVDALFRIWTFCRVFGSGKGREEDRDGQDDWFAGGTQAHEPSGSRLSGCYRDSETIALAPESFGRGNNSGLSAQETIIMLALWETLQRGLRPRVAEYLGLGREHHLVCKSVTQSVNFKLMCESGMGQSDCPHWPRPSGRGLMLAPCVS